MMHIQITFAIWEDDGSSEIIVAQNSGHLIRSPFELDGLRTKTTNKMFGAIYGDW